MCAFLVILLHINFLDNIGKSLQCIARIAVPIFFMISGYFYKKEKAINNIKKILGVFIKANLLYFFIRIVLILISSSNLKHAINMWFSSEAILKFILLNESPFGYHLWYLGAVLYVYLFVYFFRLNKFTKIILSVALYNIGVILGQYSNILFNITFDESVSRNAIFLGIPFFLIGMLMKEKENYIEEKLKNNNHIILQICVIFIVVVICLLEQRIIWRLGYEGSGDVFFITPILSIIVFAFFNYYKFETKNKIVKIFSYLGREYSTRIYILHPVIIMGINIIFKNKYNNFIELFVVAIVVFALSILFSYILKRVNKILKGKYVKSCNNIN